ncbi:hypothetical protein [Pseudomonas oryzihabitans]|uniref:Outer membrane protein beta-barrel domain-containing protein n=1 Tax=Pseudomonas oryzihabitans TaxID=47885 RepID=A0A1G5PE55_9PSED|nr:hypothetical protein [Pseudomonas psychrotolerans]NMY91663.1 hypothetical protein [Pseudomonas psychrotolerans]SCZ47806.1 hypothetical protein SAMN05216279_11694 [Pseudomonas psychrotolerans]
MKIHSKLLVSGLTCFTVAFTTQALAENSTKPIFTIGGTGSYNEYRFDGRGLNEDDKSYLGEGGLFAEFGNKVTGAGGVIYQAALSAKYGEKDDNEVKEAQADLDIGYRFAMDSINYVDATIGGGYIWNRYEPQADDLNIKLTNKAPFAKAAVGYNHKFNDATMRIELGARHTINGSAKLKADDFDSDDVDLKDRTNPYAEIGFLMNQNGQLPVYAGAYYTYTEYKLDSDSELSSDAKLKRDEYGLKLGLAF